MITLLFLLGLLTLGIVLFPLILSMVKDNYFLMAIYCIWWAPASILLMIIAAIGNALIQYLD
jgi:hypothetical protein